jgi:hypothetical protein
MSITSLLPIARASGRDPALGPVIETARRMSVGIRA